MPRCSAASRYQSARQLRQKPASDHQVDVLHVRAFAHKVFDEAAEDRGLDLLALEILVLPGHAFLLVVPSWSRGYNGSAIMSGLDSITRLVACT